MCQSLLYEHYISAHLVPTDLKGGYFIGSRFAEEEVEAHRG